MERWNYDDINIESSKKADSFLKDIVNVCKKHNLSLSHEDGHGAFIVDNYSDYNINWLYEAGIKKKL